MIINHVSKVITAISPPVCDPAQPIAGNNRGVCFVRCVLVSMALLVTSAQESAASNSKGHTVIADLAYARLSPEQCNSLVDLLRDHPHWQEYLAADRPENVPLDRWLVWRAATWPGWVRQYYREFDKPKWHYVNYPSIPPGSPLRAEDYKLPDENILTVLPECIDKANRSTGADRAIHLCWVLHLVGDIHQPLHCVSL